MNDTLSFNYDDTFNLIAASIVSSIAIIGNLAVIIILTKPKFRNEPLFRYLIVGTIFDTLNAIMIWPSINPDRFLVNEIDFLCKFNYFLNNLMSTFSVCINVLIAVDTLMIVKYPRMFKFRKSSKYQIFILLLLFFISCLINLPNLFLMGVTSRKRYCATPSFDISFYLNLYYLVLSIIIPFIIITVVSSITFFHLKETQKSINQNNLKKSKNLFNVSLGLNVLFFISSFPIFFVTIITNFTDVYISDIGFYCSLLFQYVYYSCDFFIYLLANRMFRETCYAVFRKFRNRT
jgi:hypothetical protein